MFHEKGLENVKMMKASWRLHAIIDTVLDNYIIHGWHSSPWSAGRFKSIELACITFTNPMSEGISKWIPTHRRLLLIKLPES